MQQQSVEKSMFKLLNLLRESDGIVHYIYIVRTLHRHQEFINPCFFFQLLAFICSSDHTHSQAIVRDSAFV